MKIKFIEDTANIMSLKDSMAALQERSKDLPGLGLICGQAGLGKTKSAKWYSTQFDCPYIRATATWTPRWMLQEICAELGNDPEGNTHNVFNQVKNELAVKPQLIFIDEADYLTGNWKLLETLRDIHDMTGSPFVLIGMGNIKNKLAKKLQFWSRVSQVVEFSPLAAKEISYIAYELAGLNMTDEVAEQLRQVTSGFFRDVMVALSYMERMAKANKIKSISRKMIDITNRAVLKQKAT